MRIENVEIEGEVIAIPIPETVAEFFQLQRERETNFPDSLFS